MKIINGKAFPGLLIKEHHTLRQMQDFLKRSKKINREYWKARIENYDLTMEIERNGNEKGEEEKTKFN